MVLINDIVRLIKEYKDNFVESDYDLADKILKKVKEELPARTESLFCGLNPDTEEMEVVENPDGMWGEDMSFAYNLYRERAIDIIDNRQQSLL